MKDLMAKKKWATIKELRDLCPPNENCIRIYCTQAPDVFNFQIRTLKPITPDYSKQSKPRNMVATACLTITEVEEILAYMKSEYPKMKRVNKGKLERFQPN